MSAIDHKVKEVSVACPMLRRDIRTHYQEYQKKPSYVVEDTARGKYYHIGFPEHQFIQCLDGRTTIAQALARNAATQGENALTEAQAGQLVRWLVDNDLLDTESSSQSERRRAQAVKRDRKKPKKLLQKLLFFRIPLGCPDAMFTRITPFTGWIFSSLGVMLWLALIVYTALQFAPEFSRFVKGSGQIIAPENWLRMVLIYGGLKILHEFGHGIATKKYRGEIPEWGAQLLLIVTPMAFVDATASWRFPNRWHRILVSVAGMYVELALACLCILGWIHTEPGVLNTSLHSAIIAASFITVVFNANPLMRFDGYYVLVDLLGIPNLASKGQQFLKWFGKRAVLGEKDLPLPHDVKKHPFWVPTYGILAGLWKVVIWIGIMVTLSLLFKGAGFAIACCMIAMMVIGWFYSFFKMLGEKGKGPTFGGAIPRIAILLAVLVAVGYFVRVNPTGRAVAVVEYMDKEVLRAGCSGQVVEVAVKEGERVEQGDVLIRLRNPDLETEYAQLELELNQAKIRARLFYQQDELSAFQAEQETIEGLRKKLSENKSYLANLTVTAPIAGKVIARNLSSLPGRWMQLGEELLSITPNEDRELLISIRQRDIESINSRLDDEIRCRLVGRDEDLVGKLERIESRATRAVPHDVLVSTNGGPLGVRSSMDSMAQQDDLARGGSDLDHFNSLDEQQSQMELAKPRLAARASISGDGESELMEGEWGYVRLSNAEKERLGIWLYEEISNYVREKIEQAKMAG